MDGYTYVYVCDGDVPSCEKSICRWLGRGDCSHTSDIGHARYDAPHVFDSVPGDESKLFERMRGEGAEKA